MVIMLIAGLHLVAKVEDVRVSLIELLLQKLYQVLGSIVILSFLLNLTGLGFVFGKTLVFISGGFYRVA